MGRKRMQKGKGEFVAYNGDNFEANEHSDSKANGCKWMDVNGKSSEKQTMIFWGGDRLETCREPTDLLIAPAESVHWHLRTMSKVMPLWKR